MHSRTVLPETSDRYQNEPGICLTECLKTQSELLEVSWREGLYNDVSFPYEPAKDLSTVAVFQIKGYAQLVGVVKVEKQASLQVW